MIHWKRRGVILPAYHGSWNTKWTKSGAILPQKLKDHWWMYYLGTRTDPDGEDRDYMGLARSPDLLHDAGILLIYNGASDSLTYGPAWALFDREDPSRLIARADRPFLLPELEWEKKGVVPNVIFLEGAIINSYLEGKAYYGAADRVVGAARLKITVNRP